jgi:hypothetical protein
MITENNVRPGKINPRKRLRNYLIAAFVALTSTACGPYGSNTTPLFGGSDFNLQALMVTRINTDRTTVSSTLKWNPIGGADHYELSRIQNQGAEINIGPSKIANSTLAYSDQNLLEDVPYKYVIRAFDSINKQISKSETAEIKPITTSDLKASQILGLKPPPDSNTVFSDVNLTWSTVENSDMYYASVVNNLTNQQVFGVFTKQPGVNLNISESPVSPPVLIRQELPIKIGGLEKEVRHKFTVYTIKFNNTDLNKATAIGLRQSNEVFLIR